MFQKRLNQPFWYLALHHKPLLNKLDRNGAKLGNKKM